MKKLIDDTLLAELIKKANEMDAVARSLEETYSHNRPPPADDQEEDAEDLDGQVCKELADRVSAIRREASLLRDDIINWTSSAYVVVVEFLLSGKPNQIAFTTVSIHLPRRVGDWNQFDGFEYTFQASSDTSGVILVKNARKNEVEITVDGTEWTDSETRDKVAAFSTQERAMRWYKQFGIEGNHLNKKGDDVPATRLGPQAW